MYYVGEGHYRLVCRGKRDREIGTEKVCEHIGWFKVPVCCVHGVCVWTCRCETVTKREEQLGLHCLHVSWWGELCMFFIYRKSLTGISFFHPSVSCTLVQNMRRTQVPKMKVFSRVYYIFVCLPTCDRTLAGARACVRVCVFVSLTLMSLTLKWRWAADFHHSCCSSLASLQPQRHRSFPVGLKSTPPVHPACAWYKSRPFPRMWHLNLLR